MNKYAPRKVINRIYSIVNKEDIENVNNHFIHGWADNPLSVLKYFYEQKSLPSNQRFVKNGDYVVLFHDRDIGEFGCAAWGNDPAHKQRIYKMR